MLEKYLPASSGRILVERVATHAILCAHESTSGSENTGNSQQLMKSCVP